MKRLLLVLGILLLAIHQAEAKLMVYGTYSTVNMLTGGEKNTVSSWTDMGTAYGLGFGYLGELNSQWGYEISDTYFFTRKYAYNSSTIFYLTLNILNLNAIYHVNPQLDVLGGINVSMPNTSITSGPIHTPLQSGIGYQLGGRYNFSKDWSFDAICSFINFNSNNSMYYHLYGIELSAKYLF